MSTISKTPSPTFRPAFRDKPVLLVGVSYGAAISLEALQRLPEVQGVWSEGSFGWLSHAVRRRLDCVPAVLLKPLVRMYYVLGKLDSGLWVPEVNPVHCLDGVRVPILFCHGEQDELAPFSDALPFTIATKDRNLVIGFRAAHITICASAIGMSIWLGSSTSSRAASSRQPAVACLRSLARSIERGGAGACFAGVRPPRPGRIRNTDEAELSAEISLLTLVPDV